jgi:hypothetical protein
MVAHGCGVVKTIGANANAPRSWMAQRLPQQLIGRNRVCGPLWHHPRHLTKVVLGSRLPLCLLDGGLEVDESRKRDAQTGGPLERRATLALFFSGEASPNSS